MAKLRILDLFSGIGGFSLGLERAHLEGAAYDGFETVAFCEIEEYPRKVLAKHWPNVPCYSDVRELTGERLAAGGIAVDVICGGFPCQDISFAGLGAGLAGARSGLFYEVARLVGELGPRFVILENVGALLSRGLDAVLGTLASLGYDAEWHCIPASAVGAPHRRDRVWVVAYPNCRDGEPGEVNRPRIWGEAFIEGADPDVGGASDGQKAVADALCGGRQGPGQPVQSGNPTPIVTRQAIDAVHGCVANVWRSEPDVGGSVDGFPAFLDRYVGRGLSHADSQRAVKALRDLWNADVSRSLRRAIGGLDRLQQAEVLFAFLREYEAGTHEARILVEGAEASETFLRSLRCIGQAASAPYRPGQVEQRSVEHPDAVQILPRLLAFDCAPHWAGSGWEDATPRVANGVKDRAHRLKSLGNAVVPQIPELIGNAILRALATANPSAVAPLAGEVPVRVSPAVFEAPFHANPTSPEA